MVAPYGAGVARPKPMELILDTRSNGWEGASCH